MGVLPLQYPEGQNRESLGLTGDEEFTITGITALNDGGTPRTVKVKAGDVEFDARVRIDTPGEANYYRNGGIMQYVLRSLRGLPPDLMDLGLGGRGYLLTGASRGLGFATARALVDDGARVLISSRIRRRRRRGRRGARRRARRARLGRRPRRPERRRAPGRRRPGSSSGRVDGALISVGGPAPGTVLEAAEERLAGRRRERAARHAAAGQGAGPAPGRRRRDRASCSPRRCASRSRHLAISNGLRPGLAMTAKALADELGPRGIRVFGLLPGRIATDRIAEIDAAHRRRRGRARAGPRRRIPLRRVRPAGGVRPGGRLRALPGRVLPDRRR